ncbi:hypothetical protein [Halorhabdus sp. BNX81]|uniref:hypothetical protein n=1 Tax=Halorhabdus sp. BNX81 TaxID=2980181 RepID=UPI0023DCF48E|nr:hypothetical protein [Halorhabdus sp. BNX81]
MDTEAFIFNCGELWFLALIYIEVYPHPGDVPSLGAFITLIALGLIYAIPLYFAWRIVSELYDTALSLVGDRL